MKLDRDALLAYSMCAGIALAGAVLVGFAACGCGGSVDLPPAPQAPAEDAAEGLLDAATDAPEDGGAPETGTEAGAVALCCTTGQNVLVCDPGEPFPCALVGTHPQEGTCSNAACVVGAKCQGFNGVGTVVECGR